MRQAPDVPERVVRLLRAVQGLGFDVQEPADFGRAPLAAVHSERFLDFLKTAHAQWLKMPADWGDEVTSNIFIRENNPLRGILAQAARYIADGSSPIGPNTWRSVYWSAQSAVAGAQYIAQGAREAYALCRPSGHHARVEAAGGVCYLNNAAIAAQALRGTFSRVAILDTDMHHGQGIQEIFYDRDDVLYVSIHGDPTNFYPVVAGFEDERGEGRGLGFNLNLPMPHGSGEATFFEKLELAIDAIQTFRADALVLSLGFDIFYHDPQSVLAMTTPGIGRLGATLASLGLPTLIVQEGGYDIDNLEANACAFFNGFRSRRQEQE